MMRPTREFPGKPELRSRAFGAPLTALTRQQAEISELSRFGVPLTGDDPHIRNDAPLRTANSHEIARIDPSPISSCRGRP